ncbi:MAG: SMC family ATPase [Bacteroidetes bacterium]|nr:MAG: SMC family ATPase [Bacteroidota bacterium]
MIPLRLTLEGLYSYQKRQEIDFRRLTEAELFGIFGATGSGKSSILEAISFALYNQTERLSSREPGGTAYHMMNLKSERLYIDFEFEGGINEARRYRFTVENRRHGSDFTRTRNFARKAYRWEADHWEPLPDPTAEAVIGLSYDHFKRTIIIPQGKFEDFIQLKPKDRSQMLQDIFGLERFELSGKVRSLMQKNQVDMDSTIRILQQYEGVNPEVIAENAALLKALESQRRELEARLKVRIAEREALAQLRERFERLDKQAEHLRSMKDKQPAFQKREQQLNRYLEAQMDFGTALQERKRLDRQLKSLADRLAEKQETVRQIQVELEKKKRVLAEVEARYQQRDVLLRQAEELEQVIALKEQVDVIQALVDREAKGKAKIEAAEAERKEIEQRIEAAEAQLEAQMQQRPDMSVLMALQQWYNEQQAAEREVSRWETDLNRVKEEIDRGREEKGRLAQGLGLELNPYEVSTAKLIEQLTRLEEALEDRQREQEKEQEQVRLRLRLQEMAGDLKPGDPCPLCGASDHPALAHGGVEPVELRRLEEARAQLTQRLESVRKALPALRNLLDRAQRVQQERAQAQEGLAQARKALDAHEARFIWGEPAPDGAAAVTERLAEAKALEARIEAQQRELKVLREGVRQKNQNIQEWQPALDGVRASLQKEQATFETRRAALREVDYAEHARKTPLALRAEAQQARTDYEGLESTFRTLSNEVDARKARLATLQGEIQQLSADQKTSLADQAKLTRSLDEKLAATETFATLAEVSQTLDRVVLVEAEREAIRTFERTLTEAETSLRDLQAEIGNQTFDPETLAALEAEIAAMEAEQEQLTEQIGGKAEYGRRLEADWAQKQKLQQKRIELEAREENLQTLSKLFRGSAFVNYISTTYLENLCAAANERFLKLSSNALSLEVDEDNNFLVRDLLNGGKRRSIKTLSGGQTFQAALCLALALSDQVQQQVQAKQNFFFLDEGFGSQDKQALQTIFQTLKSLRRERRIVGVISHVEELQQEIPAYLQIQNDPERGSLVQGSWEG